VDRRHLHANHECRSGRPPAVLGSKRETALLQRAERTALALTEAVTRISDRPDHTFPARDGLDPVDMTWTHAVDATFCLTSESRARTLSSLMLITPANIRRAGDVTPRPSSLFPGGTKEARTGS
jgi:hypothetical protein